MTNQPNQTKNLLLQFWCSSPYNPHKISTYGESLILRHPELGLSANHKREA